MKYSSSDSTSQSSCGGKKTIGTLFAGIAALASGIFIGFKLADHLRNSKNKSFQKPKFDHSKKVILGIDIGGTGLKLGLVSLKGKILCSVSENEHDKSFEGVCSHIKTLVDRLFKESGLSLNDLIGIGVCVPGIVDVEKAETRFIANLSLWPRPAPLGAEIKKILGCEHLPLRLDNDGNAALLAELWLGVAKSSKNAVMLMLGTGIGSAIMVDGKLLHGAKGWGAEVGHTIIERGGRLSTATGVNGVLEEYISARALGLIAQEKVKALKQSNKSKKFDSGLATISPIESISSKHVFDFASKGDPLALDLLEEFFDVLGVCCINLTRTLDIEHIILGGGLAMSGEPLAIGVRKSFAKHHWKLSEPTCKIQIADLTSQASMIGACYLAHPDYHETLL